MRDRNFLLIIIFSAIFILIGVFYVPVLKDQYSDMHESKTAPMTISQDEPM